MIKRVFNLIETECNNCKGKGIILKYENEDAYDREDDKLPSASLAHARSSNRGFTRSINCVECDGYGYFLEPIYE